MGKKALAIAIFNLFLLSACQEVPPTAQTPCELSENLSYLDSTTQELPRPCQLPEREPSADLGFHVELTDFNPEEEAKMMDALERAVIVMNSKEFKSRILNHTYNGQKTFADNNGMSNAEVYEAIMMGAEELLPEPDREMDLDITLYYKNNSTVGYTYPDTIRIWVNNKFFSKFSLGEVAGNAVHEWTHKLGFGHSFYNTPERPYTVPYAVGSIIEELVDSM